MENNPCINAEKFIQSLREKDKQKIMSQQTKEQKIVDEYVTASLDFIDGEFYLEVTNKETGDLVAELTISTDDFALLFYAKETIVTPAKFPTND